MFGVAPLTFLSRRVKFTSEEVARVRVLAVAWQQQQQQASLSQQGLAASAAAAIADVDSGRAAAPARMPTRVQDARSPGPSKDQRGVVRRRGQTSTASAGALPGTRVASPGPAFGRGGAVGSSGVATATVDGVTAGSEAANGRLAQEEVDLALASPELRPEPGQSQRGSSKGEGDVTTVANSNNGASGADLEGEIASLQQHFLRQRELLVRVLRRGADLEEKVTVLKDDLTRKDVIIHNLRQSVEAHQQEVQVQQQQFEQQQAQVQQQHQIQQLQQLQQMQEYQQRLLQQQQLQQQLQAHATGHEQLAAHEDPIQP
mmetsp:Transcript_46000/g.121446  ORF Transcript_46000/g.121446 Transcript_46000/m.121446 type:complete len:316 (+) Transcript_46000:1164-2111(+)